jgi:hypothetical protein
VPRMRSERVKSGAPTRVRGGIFLLLGVRHRSVRLACVAMIPNLLPLVLVLGALGWAGIAMDAGIVVLDCLFSELLSMTQFISSMRTTAS